MLKPGDLVGARRWPYHTCHPDAWGLPWSGTLLAGNNPDAWAHTLAFPRGLPTQEQVDAHLLSLEVRGFDMSDRVPVLWHFDGQDVIHWEFASHVRPYADEMDDWETARAIAMEHADLDEWHKWAKALVRERIERDRAREVLSTVS